MVPKLAMHAGFAMHALVATTLLGHVLRLPRPPTWVNDLSSLSACADELLRCSTLGVDAEWTGGGALGKHGTQLSCVSFASDRRSWVVEALPATSSDAGYDAALYDFLDQLLLQEGTPTVVAWAFAGDAEIIERRMLTTAAASAEDDTSSAAGVAASTLRRRMLASVIDVQLLAIEQGVGSRAQMPSLRRACETFLGASLAKEEQNSNWSDRPLRIEQREYAAMDAAAPLRIYRTLSELQEEGS